MGLNQSVIGEAALLAALQPFARPHLTLWATLERSGNMDCSLQPFALCGRPASCQVCLSHRRDRRQHQPLLFTLPFSLLLTARSTPSGRNHPQVCVSYRRERRQHQPQAHQGNPAGAAEEGLEVHWLLGWRCKLRLEQPLERRKKGW